MHVAVLAVCIILLFRVQAIVYRRMWKENLVVDIHFQKERVTEGETVVLEEMLENRKWLPLPVVYLQFKLSKFFHVAGESAVMKEDRYSRNELVSVMMNQRFKRKLEVICTKRGQYTIEAATVMAKSLFLDEEYLEHVPCESRLTVYPRMVNARQFEDLMQNVNEGQMIRPFLQEDPFLIRGVREYQIYDNMKSINWSATARTGNMKVNLVETISSRQVYVFLNVQKESLSVHNEVIEESIRLAKTFCAMFSKKGIKSQLYTNGTNGEDKEPIYVSPGVGVGYMSMVNEALTKIFIDENGNIISHGRDEELDFVELYGSVMEQAAKEGQVIFISSKRDVTVVKMLRKLHKQGLKFLWIVPVDNMAGYVEDRELKGYMRVWRLNFEGAKEAV